MDSPLYHKHSDQTSDHGGGNLNPLCVVDSSKFWAVIIGIDEYPTPQDVLHGCVRDATNVFEYLTINMGVPEDHVKLLLSPQPSNASSILLPIRANIIDTLLALSTNPRIHYGDNIVIYYAGHGTVYYCMNHPAFASLGSPGDTGTIEALCPMDRNILGTNDDKPIPDISDREFYTILDEIRRTKGHHITVILDCCHSSSQTRVSGKSIRGRRKVRALSEPTSIGDMLAVADEKLGEKLKTDDGSPRYRFVSAADWTVDVPVTSHVILAACQSYEYATEVRGDSACGVFTSGLLSSLKSIIANPADLKGALPTYLELVSGLPANNCEQHPTVAGKCMNEPLWYMGPTCSCST